MCVACGLPTTHAGLLSGISAFSVISFVTITFISAWWIVTVTKLSMRFFSKNKDHSPLFSRKRHMPTTNKNE